MAGQVTRSAGTSGRERDKRLPELLDAAVKVFWARGYREATVQEIADELGILKGSVYHYVASKQDLLAKVLDAAHEHSTELLGQVTALDAPPLAKLHEHFRLHALWYLEQPEHVTVFFRDWGFLTDSRLELVVARRREYDRFLRGLLRQCRQDGHLADEPDLKYVSFFLLGALNSAPAWYRRGGPDQAPTIAQAFADLCVATVLGTRHLPAR